MTHSGLEPLESGAAPPPPHIRIPLTIGILALQGGWVEHAHCLARLATPHSPIHVRPVRRAADLVHPAPVDGLLLPGGESTAISRLMDEELCLALQEHARTRPTWVRGVLLLLLLLLLADHRGASAGC
jgi:glutamine amidotransferase PdxT